MEMPTRGDVSASINLSYLGGFATFVIVLANRTISFTGGEMSGPTKADITIVMCQRERFGLTRRSVASVFEHSDCPFKFIYVDGCSPSHTHNYLREESKRRDFTLIRTEYFLTPNEARNRGFAHVDTPYVVFVDNDMIFTPNWLQPLIHCAEETGADVVTPVICIGEPLHTTIHFAGGDARIVEESGRRIFRESHHFAGQLLAKTHAGMVRHETELAEFHCMLVRTDILRRLGPLDERLTAIAEHVDLCLSVRRHGGKVMFEPESIVTYIAEPPQGFRDNAFYYYRWCDEYAWGSERHFHAKWGTEFNDDVARHFVVPHRRRAILWQRAQALVGWRMSEFLFKHYGNWLTSAAMRRRDRLMTLEPNESADQSPTALMTRRTSFNSVNPKGDAI
jgi:GT2 family glycosyltransferase